jgi:hypothetical protein
LARRALWPIAEIWRLRLRSIVVFAMSLAAAPLCGQQAQPAAARPPLRGALLDATQATDQRISQLKSTGTNTIVLPLADAASAPAEPLAAAAKKVREHGLLLYYWIEVGRCPQLADAHPEWMASLQGHDEWRRLFSDAPRPRDDEVMKVYPWVPLLNQEAYDAHLQRVTQQLAGAPDCDGVLLNDLQGAPSACGCGNMLCRWTTDYGPIHTATPAPDDAAARFVAAIQRRMPRAAVIPVWVTECEEHDGAADGACAGVGCFRGICWKAYTRQLMPVAAASPRLAVLTPYVALQRDLPVYAGEAAWIAQAVTSFQTMPPRHQGTAIEAARLITVLQAWDLDDRRVMAQVQQSNSAGAGGYIVAYAPIEQDWQPRLYRWK